MVKPAFLGQAVALLTTWLLQGGPTLLAAVQGPVETLPLGTQLVVSLGAGLYEELLFRVLLVTALLWLGLKLGSARTVTSSRCPRSPFGRLLACCSAGSM